MKREKIIQSIVDDIKKTLASIKKLPWFLGLHAFGIVLFLVLIDLALGGYFFYQYIYLVKIKEPESISVQDILDEKNYQLILDQWKKKEDNFNKIQPENIKNPFEKPNK